MRSTISAFICRYKDMMCVFLCLTRFHLTVRTPNPSVLQWMRKCIHLMDELYSIVYLWHFFLSFTYSLMSVDTWIDFYLGYCEKHYNKYRSANVTWTTWFHLDTHPKVRLWNHVEVPILVFKDTFIFFSIMGIILAPPPTVSKGSPFLVLFW